MKRAAGISVAVAIMCAVGCVRPVQEPDPTRISPSQQLEVRMGWLEQHHALLLDMMRRHDVAMWIVVNEEFHDDPLTQFVAPPLPYVGGRDLFVFIDAGEDGLRRVAITGFADENVRRFFESPSEPRPAKEVLPELIAEHQPATIALSIGGHRGVTRSLTLSSYEWLSEISGPETSARFVSAADLIEEYLDTRIPEELEWYRSAVELTAELNRGVFSNEVLVPGTTTIGELRRWLLDRYAEHGVEPWFLPDFRVQRKGWDPPTSRGFLAVAPDSTVVERGDLLHVDMGFNLMGLATDWQKMAYVLREGELAPPDGLQVALARTNQLQDAVCRLSRPGKSAGEIYQEVMAAMDNEGIEAQVYSHPLGNQGHGLGPSIDFRTAEREDAEEREAKALRAGSYFAVELNTSSEVPEWDGQTVWIMEEDPAFLTDQGWQFFVPRQEAFFLIE